MPEPFQLTSSVTAGAAYLTLCGELDYAVKQEFHDHVNGLLADDTVTSVVVDLTRVTFIDSTGIGGLIRGLKTATATGRHFSVTGVHGPVQRVFDLTGVSAALSRSRPEPH